MRLRPIGQYLMLVLSILLGLVGIYLGYFRSGTVCDSSACHYHAAGTIEPVFTFGGVAFLVFGVYFLYRALRRRNLRGPSRDDYRGENIAAMLQVRLANEVRTFYTKRSAWFYNPASPSEFDHQMLSLLQSIEAGAPDIDTKIEALRSYVRSEGRFQRWKDQYKANMLWRKGDESLAWLPETWQLRTNWARLRLLAPTFNSYTMAPGWVAPAWHTAQSPGEPLRYADSPGQVD